MTRPSDGHDAIANETTTDEPVGADYAGILGSTVTIAIFLLIGLASHSSRMALLPRLAVAGLTGWLAWPMLRRCYRLWPKAAYATFRRTIRTTRRLRSFYRPGASVDFMATLGVVAMLVVFEATVVTTHDLQFHHVGWCLFLILVVVGAMECWRRMRRLMGYAWARVVGRICLAGLAALVALTTHAIAQHVAFAINPIDPAHVQNFVILLALLLTPVLYLYAFAFLIYGWSFVEIVSLVVLGLVSGAIRQLAAPFGLANRTNDLIYRLIYGRRRTREPQKDLLQDCLVFFVRVASMTAFVVAVALPFAAVLEGRDSFIKENMQRAQVYIDYRHGPLCGMDPHGYYLPLDDKHVSVATMNDSGVLFASAECRP